MVKVVRFRRQGRRNLLNVYGGPRFRVSPRVVNFQLSGFWDSASGQLCMVGLGTKPLIAGKPLEFDAVFKCNYPNNSVITSSLVTGTLESLNPEGSQTHFRPISIMGISRTNYEYTLIKNEVENGLEESEKGNLPSNVSLGPAGLHQRCYRFISLSDNFELAYNSFCDGRNCSLLDVVLGFLPKYMSLNEIDCSGQRMVRVAFGLSDTSDIRHGYRQPLNPRSALIAEGTWNARNNQFLFVACRILNFTDSPLSASVGDCSIRVNFTFPASLTIRTPSIINGHIWSSKTVGELGYFDRSEIHASGTRRGALPNMRYEYSEIEKAKEYCAKKKVFKHKGQGYPNPYSQDMKFDMDVRNTKGQKIWGKAHPVFVGDHFVEDFHPYFFSTVMARPVSDTPVNNTHNGLLNITYWISLSPKNEFQVGGRSLEINRTVVLSAEGVYDIEAGRLCMVGCWNHEMDVNLPQNISKLDCDIFIDIQFPSGNSNGGDVVKGTIISKRQKSDPFYFEHMDLSATSLTKTQVDRVFWRMDFEIAMVLVSNTLTCIFVAVQLFHVKRHPDELPFISIVMLILITLGHMIPLLLNMEAFFLSSPRKKTVFFGSGGWLEMNEVLVRVITMVAFLLEFRLLQLTWSSRANDGSPNSLWSSEKKVILYSLPLYLFGALVAWLIQRLRGSPRTTSQFHQLHFRSSDPTLPFWHDVKSYAGFTLDAFLLPQIMFNVFSDSKGTALCIPYYVGTTIVRLLPHTYDLFRGHISAWNLDTWYIYANPGMNYYSTAWDILISCIGLLFVVLIYLQQRFGGRFIVPKRFRVNATYEKVPVGL